MWVAMLVQIENHRVDDFPSEFEVERSPSGRGVQVDPCAFGIRYLNSLLNEHRGAAFPVICRTGIERFQYFGPVSPGV